MFDAELAGIQEFKDLRASTQLRTLVFRMQCKDMCLDLELMALKVLYNECLFVSICESYHCWCGRYRESMLK